jgi:hypothetical protein
MSARTNSTATPASTAQPRVAGWSTFASAHVHPATPTAETTAKIAQTEPPPERALSGTGPSFTVSVELAMQRRHHHRISPAGTEVHGFHPPVQAVSHGSDGR